MTLTLSAKEARLRNTVALPNRDDWQLLIEDKAKEACAVADLNAVLVCVLERAKTKKYQTWGTLRADLHKRMRVVTRRYPRGGIFDSEGRLTMARFFAVNYDISIYDFIRFD